MKQYILIAGANGVGKSTIYGLTPDLKGIPYINFDKLDKKVGAFEAIRMIDSCFNNCESMVQETTLCGKSILANLERAKDADYRIIIHYIGVDSVSICKKRIRSRVAKGGHDIPEEDTERRYKNSFERIKTILPICDEIYFYDNTVRFVKIAKVIKGKIVWKSDKTPKWWAKIFTTDSSQEL